VNGNYRLLETHNLHGRMTHYFYSSVVTTHDQPIFVIYNWRTIWEKKTLNTRQGLGTITLEEGVLLL